MRDIRSFTSANVFPIKLLRNLESLSDGLRPLHVSVMPTNKCTQGCAYCVCKNRDKDQSLGLDDFAQAIVRLKEYGTKAVTFTGGGEPLAHHGFNLMVKMCREAGMKLGLVTNGDLVEEWAHEDESPFDSFDWIRVSYDMMRHGLPATPDLGTHGYSYVYAPGSELTAEWRALIEMVRGGQLTHLRITADVTRAQDEAYNRIFHTATRPLRENPVAGVFVQPRADYRPGARRCWLSLVKPVLHADGEIYPC